LNGASKNRLPNNINISFQFTEVEALLIMLDMAGVCASAGSACSSGLNISSHVLTAIGLPKDIADGALRLTIGHENTLEEIDSVVDIIKEAVKKLRAMSPVYEDFIKNKSIEEE
jgi:cysteine desulfurase